MTTLYILRHGIAVERGTAGIENDADRPLTAEGEKKTKQIAQALKVLKVEVDLILTSPFIRAHRTAVIVASVLKATKKLEMCKDLAVGGDPKAVLRSLNKRTTPATSVVLVGHEPYLSQLISVLLSGDESLNVDLKKGGLCRLAAERLRYGRCATLEWLLTPRVLLRGE